MNNITFELRRSILDVLDRVGFRGEKLDVVLSEFDRDTRAAVVDGVTKILRASYDRPGPVSLDDVEPESALDVLAKRAMLSRRENVR